MLEKEKLVFHPITLKDREWMTEKLSEEDIGACEYTFANNFIWSEVYEVEVGQAYDCGVIRYREHGNFEYSFPFGNGDKKSAVELLRGICKAHHHKLCLYPIEEKDRKKLIEWFPGEFEIDIDRSDFDYVYTVEKLSKLQGRKLHGKRNHIARFMDDDDWSYEELDQENIEECRTMAKRWADQKEDKWNAELAQEMRVLEKALTYYGELELFGGVLRKKGEIVAFTIGERLNSDTMVVHFEKAFPNLQGAYPMINQQFVLHRGKDYTYVNREEDTGDPGLRKAKLSYCPDILLKKYSAVESHVVFANETDREAIIHIWEQCFGDSEEYIRMYLENRFTTENMMVIHADGRPVSMASFLPAEIILNGKREEARYVYAVATLPAYRGRGYASEMIKHGIQKYKEPLILQPADEGLKRFYQTMGFWDAFLQEKPWNYELAGVIEKNQRENETANTAENHPEIKMSEVFMEACKIEMVTASEYKRLRDAYFNGEGYVEWDDEAIAYAMEENAFWGGETLKLIFGGEEKIIMYCMEEKQLFIKETTMTKEELTEVLPGIMKQMGVREALRPGSGGMLLLSEGITWSGQGYFNLALG